MLTSQHSQAYLQRFNGIARLYGQQVLQRFSQVSICVIGIGGVGSWAAEALARSGICSITLIDMDDICVSNTNRQIHTLQENVGKTKIDVMAQRIRQINPECQVTAIDDFINVDNVGEYLSADFDYVIDAVDDIRAKAAIIAYCRRNKIPLIVIGGAGGQIDPTQIEVTDLAKTIQDPLVAKLRERLKRDYHIVKNSRGKLGIDCVFSTEPLVYPQADGSVCHNKAADGVNRMDCATGFGATTVVTASFAFIAVAHILKKIKNRVERETK